VNNLVQVEAGQLQMDLSEVELPELLKEAFSLTSPMANKSNIELVLPRRGDVAYKVTADKKRLKQVFLNLISNAIKYNSPNGQVSINVVAISEERIKIGVKDTGKGIAKQDMPKLFEAFNRLGAEKSNIEGTGIGLTITKNIVELMGGSLDVESSLEQGSTFWVNLSASKI